MVCVMTQHPISCAGTEKNQELTPEVSHEPSGMFLKCTLILFSTDVVLFRPSRPRSG